MTNTALAQVLAALIARGDKVAATQLLATIGQEGRSPVRRPVQALPARTDPAVGADRCQDDDARVRG